MSSRLQQLLPGGSGVTHALCVCISAQPCCAPHYCCCCRCHTGGAQRRNQRRTVPKAQLQQRVAGPAAAAAVEPTAATAVTQQAATRLCPTQRSTCTERYACLRLRACCLDGGSHVVYMRVPSLCMTHVHAWNSISCAVLYCAVLCVYAAVCRQAPPQAAVPGHLHACDHHQQRAADTRDP